MKAMAKTCVKCPDGSWVCGEDPDCTEVQLEQPAGGWDLFGKITIDVEVYHKYDAKGNCRIRLKPI